MKNFTEEMERQFLEKIKESRLSDELKEKANQLHTVKTNKNLTLAQIKQKVEEIKKGLKKEDLKQIRNVMHELMRVMQQRKTRNAGCMSENALSNVDCKNAKQFMAIISNTTATKQQISDEILKWKSSQIPEVQATFFEIYNHFLVFQKISMSKFRKISEKN